mgnify:CR=1 FL=1
MDNWVLIGPKMLEKQSQTETEVGATQVKVRVTHVLVSAFDGLAYTGATKSNFCLKPFFIFLRLSLRNLTRLFAICNGGE